MFRETRSILLAGLLATALPTDSWAVLPTSGMYIVSSHFDLGAITRYHIGSTSGESLGTGSQATLSPDGKLIAYANRGQNHAEKSEIWIMNSDGTGKKRIHDGMPWLSELAWENDSRHVVFNSDTRVGDARDGRTNKIWRISTTGELFYVGTSGYYVSHDPDIHGTRVLTQKDNNVYEGTYDPSRSGSLGNLKYVHDGCSGTYGPDGNTAVANVGDHTTFDFLNRTSTGWKIVKNIRVSTATGGKCSDYEYSNHADYVVCQRQDGTHATFLVQISTGNVHRLTPGSGRDAKVTLFVGNAPSTSVATFRLARASATGNQTLKPRCMINGASLHVTRLPAVTSVSVGSSVSIRGYMVNWKSLRMP